MADRGHPRCDDVAASWYRRGGVGRIEDSGRAKVVLHCMEHDLGQQLCVRRESDLAGLRTENLLAAEHCVGTPAAND